MNTWKKLVGPMLLLLIVALVMVQGVAEAKPPSGGGGGGGGGHTETAGNNLSFPVIWAENVPKTLRGTQGEAALGGKFWYWWGTAADDTPLSCEPHPTIVGTCLDGTVPPEGAIKAYLQQDALNVWQADSASPAVLEDGTLAKVVPNWIDWGDNLESVDWYLRSMVRTEVVLFKDLDAPMLQYDMRHLYGWGQSEMWGIATELVGEELEPVIVTDNTQATIYSHCARLTIQKLNVSRDDPRLADLIWVPTVGYTEPEGYPDNLINEPLFNKAVWGAGDGPGYYAAEINVKGKIIYGYTWNVRRLNEGAADYRITFSFDEVCGTVALNTFFEDGVTQIMQPAEEEEAAAVVVLDRVVPLAEPIGDSGGTAVLDFDNNLTYMDIHILARGGGGK